MTGVITTKKYIRYSLLLAIPYLLHNKELNVNQVQNALFFISKLLKRDFGYSFNFYGVCSKLVDIEFRQLFTDGILNMSENKLYFTPEEVPEDIAYRLRKIVKKVVNDYSFISRLDIAVATYKSRAILGNDREKLTLLLFTKIMGWEVTDKYFRMILTRLKWFNFKYVERVRPLKI